MTDTATAHRPPPLAGLKVIDFTRVLAGPWATLILGDLGADIIKVENPDGGDDSRRHAILEQFGEQSGYFMFSGRNKRSICLNIASAEGQAIARKLIADADVLVENFRPGVMARQGLDYDSLAKINPGLIYCSISGYGHDSPMRNVAGYDPVAQAESGVMSLTGERGGEPLRTAVGITDLFTGMFAVNGILAALRARDRDNAGQFLDIALLDCALASTVSYGQVALMTGEVPERWGNGSPLVAPMGLMDCADGKIELIISSPRHWGRFCEGVIGRPDLTNDPRFATPLLRVANSDELNTILRSIFIRDTRAGWMEKFRKVGVPAGTLRNLVEALHAPEIRHRGMIREVEHPRAGRIEVIGSPIRMSGTPVAEPFAAPMLGEHTETILAEHGYTPDEVAAFAAKGAIPGR